MSWSLLNHSIADKVSELIDAHKDDYPPEEPRFFSREQALAIIHAAIWGYSVRASSTAGCYAATNLYEALGLKWWTFDAEEAAIFQKIAQERQTAKAKSSLPQSKQT